MATTLIEAPPAEEPFEVESQGYGTKAGHTSGAVFAAEEGWVPNVQVLWHRRGSEFWKPAHIHHAHDRAERAHWGKPPLYAVSYFPGGMVTLTERSIRPIPQED